MTKNILLMTILGMVILSGCASQRDIMIQEGHSVAYADGFEHGCSSGKKAGGNMFESFKKDENRFTNNSKYSQGWSDGFRQCLSEQKSFDRQMRITQERQRLIEEKKRNKKLDKRYMEQHALDGIKYDVKTLNKLK